MNRKNQTVTEATVYVDVPQGTRARDVSCTIEPRRLRLEVRGAAAAVAIATASSTLFASVANAPGGVKPETNSKAGERTVVDGDVIIDGILPSAISRDDSLWSLNDGNSVVISLEKVKRSWWESVVEGDPEIDTTKVRKKNGGGAGGSTSTVSEPF